MENLVVIVPGINSGVMVHLGVEIIFCLLFEFYGVVFPVRTSECLHEFSRKTFLSNQEVI